MQQKNNMMYITDNKYKKKQFNFCAALSFIFFYQIWFSWSKMTCLQNNCL